MKDKYKELVPVSKKLIRKQFKDYKKKEENDPYSYNIMEKLSKPQEKINHINSELKKLMSEPKNKREENNDYSKDILVDRKCLPSTMSLRDKYYKETKKDEIDKDKKEEDLQLEDYADRLNSYLVLNLATLSSYGKEDKKTPQ
jgi:hypothetical protein